MASISNTNPASQSVSILGADSAALLARLRETGKPVALQHQGQDVAVVVGIERYKSLVEELDLLRDIQVGLADVEAGRVIPHEEVRTLLRERYAG